MSDLEALYWRYDSMHKGNGEWEQAPWTERDAFKDCVTLALSEQAETIQQLRDGLSELETMVDLGQGRIAVKAKIKALQEQGQ